MIMKMPFYVTWFLLGLLFSSEQVLAVGRGGSCNDTICVFTGTIVGLILLGGFLLSVTANIAEKGLILGLIEHKGLRAIFFYCSVVFGFVWISAKLLEIDKTLAITFCVVSMVVLHKLSSSAPSPRNAKNESNKP